MDGYTRSMILKRYEQKEVYAYIGIHLNPNSPDFGFTKVTATTRVVDSD
jgi:hypothetical protein